MEIPNELLSEGMKRYMWIYNREEPFSRRDICKAFGVSLITASRSIANYRKQHPDVLYFDFGIMKYLKKGK